jgi:truncated hemoglobin YjbI
MTQAEWILKVVESFYLKAKTDILIGYHFRIISDFDEHIPRIAAFWDLQLLGKTSQKISPPFDVMNLHLALGIKRGEIGRWLVLFRKTLEEETTAHPEMESLKHSWEEKLLQFEGIFLRFLGL